jgi:hypothetical protein
MYESSHDLAWTFAGLCSPDSVCLQRPRRILPLLLTTWGLRVPRLWGAGCMNAVVTCV